MQCWQVGLVSSQRCLLKQVARKLVVGFLSRTACSVRSKPQEERIRASSWRIRKEDPSLIFSRRKEKWLNNSRNIWLRGNILTWEQKETCPLFESADSLTLLFFYYHAIAFQPQVLPLLGTTDWRGLGSESVPFNCNAPPDIRFCLQTSPTVSGEIGAKSAEWLQQQRVFC